MAALSNPKTAARLLVGPPASGGNAVSVNGVFRRTGVPTDCPANRSLEDELTLAALRMALTNRPPPPGLIHHSDRGVQYAPKDYTDLLKALRTLMFVHGAPGVVTLIRCCLHLLLCDPNRLQITAVFH
jgi:hypothetical protein